MAQLRPIRGSNSPRLLCLDVDGTLVSQAGDLYEASAGLLQAANEKSFAVALCSARPLQSLVGIANDLSSIRFVSALQGTVVAERQGCGDGKTFPIVFTATGFDKTLISDIRILLADARETEIWCFGATEWFVKHRSKLVAREVSITAVEPHVLDDPMSIGCIYKITVVSSNLEELAAIERGLMNLPVQVARSHPGQIEIVPTGGEDDKGVARLRYLLGGVSEVTIALGDGMNDLGMLQAADVAVTFKDAPIQLRLLAHVVMSENREVGLREMATFLHHERWVSSSKSRGDLQIRVP